MTRIPPTSTLFPYTTLFRSITAGRWLCSISKSRAHGKDNISPIISLATSSESLAFHRSDSATSTPSSKRVTLVEQAVVINTLLPTNAIATILDNCDFIMTLPLYEFYLFLLIKAAFALAINECHQRPALCFSADVFYYLQNLSLI